MSQLLMRLKAAVDDVLQEPLETRTIDVSEFPSYVVKSLEAILSDDDETRAECADHRNGVLQRVR